MIKRFSWVTLANLLKTTTITKKANIASNNEKKAKNKVNTNKQSKQNSYKERILNKNLCEMLNDLLFYMLYEHHDLVIL